MKPIRRKSERGNAMLEFALGFSLLWMLFSGVYQIGYAYYIYDRLTVATENAVQLGSGIGYDTGKSQHLFDGAYRIWSYMARKRRVPTPSFRT